MEMARPIRIDVGSEIYHVLWRGNNGEKIFHREYDYLLFENTLINAVLKFKMRILSFVCMPNHIHFCFSPLNDKEVGKFMHWLGTTFTHKYRLLHKNLGNGHVFQDRYKSIIVQKGETLLNLLLYIERNPLKAKLVIKSEDWRWSSLWIRQNGNKNQRTVLAEWPIEIPPNYSELVNETKEDAEIKDSIQNQIPLGDKVWQEKIRSKFNVRIEKAKRGRPKNK
jgi:putative transposase